MGRAAVSARLHTVTVDGFGTLEILALGRAEVEECGEVADDLAAFNELLVDRAVPDEQFTALTVEEIAAVLTEYPDAIDQVLAAIVAVSWKPGGH